MWFKIALSLGCSVYELKNKLTLKEFRKWGAFFELEREDYSQTDVNIARLALLVNNYICKSDIKISDVLPQARKRKMSDTEGCLALKTLFTALQRTK